MKKVFLLPLCAAAFAVSSHASFTETPTTIGTVEGVEVSGTGSVSELSAASYNFVKFGGTTLNFDNNDFLFQTTNDDVMIGSSRYSLGITAASTINVTGTGGVKIGTATSENGGISLGAATTINIAEGSSGIITGKIAVVVGDSTLNLHKENAFVSNYATPTTLLNLKTVNLNTDKDQTFKMDFRNGSKEYFTITDGATLLFSKARVHSTGITSTMTFTDGLVDGTFMIAMSYVDSYDKSLSQIVVKESSKTTTITVNGLDAAARWTEEEIGGKSYLCISAAPIPEASTYAAIFGAIALGFAAYRRRK